MDIASIEKLASKFAQTAAPAVDPHEKEIVSLLSRMIAAGQQVAQKMQAGATYSAQLNDTLVNLQGVVQKLVSMSSPSASYNSWRKKRLGE